MSNGRSKYQSHIQWTDNYYQIRQKPPPSAFLAHPLRKLMPLFSHTSNSSFSNFAHSHHCGWFCNFFYYFLLVGWFTGFSFVYLSSLFCWEKQDWKVFQSKRLRNYDNCLTNSWQINCINFLQLLSNNFLRRILISFLTCE